MNKNIVFIKKLAKSALKAFIPSPWHGPLKRDSELWNSVLKNSASGQKILIATSMGCYDHALMLESSLATALTLRGAAVDILLCDNFLPCCQMIKVSGTPPDVLINQNHSTRCETCYDRGLNYYGALGLPIRRFSRLLSKTDVETAERISLEIQFEKIGGFTYQLLAIGEHALAGALRYFARGNLNGEPYGEKILRLYLKASLLTAFAVMELLRQNKYDVAVFHHGIYVPQGIIGEVCRKEGVHVVNWNPSYRKQTFIFSHDDSYHHTMITEPVSEWENINWSHETEKITLDYLKSRWSGIGDWIWFHEKPIEDIDKIGKELGINFNKPCIGMLTSVMWDAQLHYKSNAFKNMLDWVFQSIDYFSKRPDLQLIIRVHPAEVRGMVPSRQKLADEVRKAYPDLPENIFLIPPESRISTYSIMEKCNSVIIYNTKTGIEISSMGIPVIVAGEAWIRNKGFSIDVSSPEEYFSVLDKLPLSRGLNKEKLERARKYACHFFLHRMIEVPFIVPRKKHMLSLHVKSLRELLPGVHQGLDVICNGILDKKSFMMDAVAAIKNKNQKVSYKKTIKKAAL